MSPTPAPAEEVACDPGPGDGKDSECSVQKGPAGPSKTPVGGLTAAQLRAAYGLPAAAAAPTSTSPLVAIVDAYDDKSAENDLNAYRQQFGLPACTSKSGCFTVAKMKATPGQPPGGPGPGGAKAATATWGDEIALDLAMASAACPSCRLLLVEAGGQDLDSLASGVNLAATYNPVAIGNSWGVVEGGGNAANIDAGAQAAFNHPGIAITASTGDLGSGNVQFPASSPYVTAVGGSTLTSASSAARGYTESVWSGSANGCSTMFGLPAWQTIANGCSGRAVPDVTVIADTNPGVAVYSSADGGWVVLGGTSIGAPFVAGLYGAANDYGSATVGAPTLYANAAALNSVGGSATTLLSPNGLTGF